MQRTGTCSRRSSTTRAGLVRQRGGHGNLCPQHGPDRRAFRFSIQRCSGPALRPRILDSQHLDPFLCQRAVPPSVPQWRGRGGDTGPGSTAAAGSGGSRPERQRPSRTSSLRSGALPSGLPPIVSRLPPPGSSGPRWTWASGRSRRDAERHDVERAGGGGRRGRRPLRPGSVRTGASGVTDASVYPAFTPMLGPVHDRVGVLVRHGGKVWERGRLQGDAGPPARPQIQDLGRLDVRDQISRELLQHEEHVHGAHGLMTSMPDALPRP
jgi:hypothetical protein